MLSTRMVTVREGTRMPQSFRNAWRWLIGASAAAMLIASISPAANAQTPDTGVITLCVARNGKIVGVDIQCKPHNLQLTWNIPGPQGPQGLQGYMGPAGAPGSVGPTGSQGLVGIVGPTGPMGSMGLTGPEGDPGLTGPTGPTGNSGHPGPTGPTGDMGMTGPSGTPSFPFPSNDNVELLSGGTLGGTIGGAANIQLTEKYRVPFIADHAYLHGTGQWRVGKWCLRRSCSSCPGRCPSNQRPGANAGRYRV